MANICVSLLLLILICITRVTSKRITHCGPNEKREQGKCVKCPECPTGEGLEQDCGFGHGAGLQCVPCETGVTYRRNLSYKKCKLCTNCTFYNREFLFLCRRVIDSECGICLPGYFEANTEPSNPPTICIPCSNGPLKPQCLKYSTTTPELRTATKATQSSLLKTEEIKENADNPYKYATWGLLIALLLALVVILSLVYTLKRYAAFHYCERRNICSREGYQTRKNKSNKDDENNERINLIVPDKDNSNGGKAKQQSTTNSELAIPRSKPKKVNENRPVPQHQPVTLVLEKSVQSAPKVGRSLSDPGPTSSNDGNDNPVRRSSDDPNNRSGDDFRRSRDDPTNRSGNDFRRSRDDPNTRSGDDFRSSREDPNNRSGDDRNNNIIDDFIIQIPPAVVHVPCITDLPNMAVPFNTDSRNIQANANNDDAIEGIGSVEHESALLITALEFNSEILPDGNVLNRDSVLLDLSNDINGDTVVDSFPVDILDVNANDESFHISEASTLPVRDIRDEQHENLDFSDSGRNDAFNTDTRIHNRDSFNVMMSNIDENVENEGSICASEASTLLIREQPCILEPSFERRDEINDVSAIQGGFYSRECYNIPPISNGHNENLLDIPMESSVENNVDINDLGGDETEPPIASSVIHQSPATIQITINNNIGATGVTKTSKKDKAINAVNGDESDNSSDSSESDSSQTIPKCLDFSSANSGSSCALAHASSMKPSYCIPVQETVQSN